MTEERRFPRINLEALLWIAVLGFVGYRIWPQVAAAFGIGAGDASAPEIRVETLAGEEITLGGLRGQVVLVNFWATWCPPCRFEMPGFQRVYEAHRDRGFTILGLSTDVGTPDLVRNFITEHDITYPIAAATAETTRAFGGVRALPTSYLIDRAGRIRYTVRGIFTETALEQAVERLLTETPDSAAAGGTQ